MIVYKVKVFSLNKTLKKRPFKGGFVSLSKITASD